MIYRFLITVPAGTTKTNARETELKLSRGIVHQVFISFPPGPQGDAHLVLEREGHQVWPSNPEEDFAWDSYTFPFRDFLPIESEPYSMYAKMWNDDNVNAYPIQVILCILPREVLEGVREELGILKRMERLIFGGK